MDNLKLKLYYNQLLKLNETKTNICHNNIMIKYNNFWTF